MHPSRSATEVALLQFATFHRFRDSLESVILQYILRIRDLCFVITTERNRSLEDLESLVLADL